MFLENTAMLLPALTAALYAFAHAVRALRKKQGSKRALQTVACLLAGAASMAMGVLVVATR